MRKQEVIIFVKVANLLAEEFIKIMAFIIDIELTAAKELIEEIYYLGLDMPAIDSRFDRPAISSHSLIWFTKVTFIIIAVIYIIFMAKLFKQVFYHLHQVNYPISITIQT